MTRAHVSTIPQGGTVAYFAVEDFDAFRDTPLRCGCAMHRGPISIAGGRRICQLRDPFGVIWGVEEIRVPSRSPQTLTPTVTHLVAGTAHPIKPR